MHGTAVSADVAFFILYILYLCARGIACVKNGGSWYHAPESIEIFSEKTEPFLSGIIMSVVMYTE